MTAETAAAADFNVKTNMKKIKVFLNRLNLETGLPHPISADNMPGFAKWCSFPLPWINRIYPEKESEDVWFVAV